VWLTLLPYALMACAAWSSDMMNTTFGLAWGTLISCSGRSERRKTLRCGAIVGQVMGSVVG
jgi:hypothetical protein